jgi:nucleotide-binding universal stress UspA family protein
MMSYRDILGIVLGAGADESVIAIAAALAEKDNGRATTLLIEPEPEPPYVVDAAVMGSWWAEIVADAHKQFREEESVLEARLAREARPITLRSLKAMASSVPERAALEARHADIVVLGRPVDEERQAIFESVLFGAGRPVVVAPPNWRPGSIGRHVAIGWNAKREAARALADARPMLESADKVTVITVDAKPGAFGHGEAPGADIAAHLARCGLKVDLVNVDSLGRSDAQALVEEARAKEADLLVLGGYGHARLQETVFGGVTREIVRNAPLPLLMSH